MSDRTSDFRTRYDTGYQRTRKLLDAFPAEQMGDFEPLGFLRFMLFGQIHHRGQLSVYVRMTGGKVPAIYGPSGDEPWN